MFMSRAVLVALALTSGAALAEGPNLGIPVTQDDIAVWDINVLPDGTGLPPGSGTAEDGAAIFQVKCAWCHGIGGEGGTHHALIGDEPLHQLVESIQAGSHRLLDPG